MMALVDISMTGKGSVSEHGIYRRLPKLTQGRATPTRLWFYSS
jgi:hypothetical protein